MSKYLWISDQIERQIRGGQLAGGRLPSARDVAGEHRVSLVTAARALRVLRDKGLIRTVERSGSFLVPPVDAGESWALCLRVTPGPWQTASQSVTRAGFDALARRGEIRVDAGALDPSAAADRRGLRARVRRAAALVKGVFLLPSRLDEESAREDESLVAACRDEGLPVVLIERNLRGRARRLDLDLVATDDLDGGLRLTRHMIEQGRERVAFVLGSPTSSHEARLAGYLAALQDRSAESGRPAEPIVLEQPTGVPHKLAYRAVADELVRRRADAVVCFQDYTAIGLIVDLLARGVRVPRDLAVSGFDDLPIGNSFALGVTTYAFPSEAVAREALRVARRRIEDPSAPPVKVLVPGDLIVRESSAGA